MEVPEGRDSSKVLGCQRNEHYQMVLKEMMEGINVVRLDVRLDCLWDLVQDEAGAIANSALELLALRPKFRELIREGRLEWALMSS